jgi:hypothetical protein
LFKLELNDGLLANVFESGHGLLEDSQLPGTERVRKPHALVWVGNGKAGWGV